MCLGKRDDRDLGVDRKFAGFRNADERGEKAGIVTGEVREMAVIERIEYAAGRVFSRGKLSGKVVLKNSSANRALRLFGGRIQYLDGQGQPIKLEGTRTRPALKLSADGSDRLEPGQEAKQALDVDFPVEVLKAKALKEVRLELVYIPLPYQAETVHLNLTIGRP